MLDITKCYSILIASGNGDRCNELRDILRKELLAIDESTGKYKVVIMKFGRNSMSADYDRISEQVAVSMSLLFTDVDDHYFSIDLPKRAE